MSNTLALLGGKPVRTKNFPKYPALDDAEKNAVLAVIESGNLSTFSTIGSGIHGGQKIQTFEKNFAEYFGSKYALAVNSATAGLHCALAAAGVGPGDEVITTPYSFTATASCILMANAIPVFADVDPLTYCIDPKEIEKKITDKTKAIIPVHLLGHPANMDEIMQLAKQHNLIVIEDCAQAPGAVYKNKKVGTIGHIGVFSFQETKNISVGEGGMIITDDAELTERCRMIRNHGESIIQGKDRKYLSNIVGWNYRMTELEAAVGIEQLKKFDSNQKKRKQLFFHLSENLADIPGLYPPLVRDVVEHGYHVFGMRFVVEEFGISRETFIKAVQAEGIPCRGGYPHPLYMNPIFIEKVAYGIKGCPYSCPFYGREITYQAGDCPVVEDLCKNTAFWISTVYPTASIEDMNDIIHAIHKVANNLVKLQAYEKETKAK